MNNVLIPGLQFGALAGDYGDALAIYLFDNEQKHFLETADEPADFDQPHMFVMVVCQLLSTVGVVCMLPEALRLLATRRWVPEGVLVGNDTYGTVVLALRSHCHHTPYIQMMELEQWLSPPAGDIWKRLVPKLASIGVRLKSIKHHLADGKPLYNTSQIQSGISASMLMELLLGDMEVVGSLSDDLASLALRLEKELQQMREAAQPDAAPVKDVTPNEQ